MHIFAKYLFAKVIFIHLSAHYQYLIHCYIANQIDVIIER